MAAPPAKMRVTGRIDVANDSRATPSPTAARLTRVSTATGNGTASGSNTPIRRSGTIGRGSGTPTTAGGGRAKVDLGSIVGGANTPGGSQIDAIAAATPPNRRTTTAPAGAAPFHLNATSSAASPFAHLASPSVASPSSSSAPITPRGPPTSSASFRSPSPVRASPFTRAAGSNDATNTATPRSPTRATVARVRNVSPERPAHGPVSYSSSSSSSVASALPATSAMAQVVSQNGRAMSPVQATNSGRSSPARSHARSATAHTLPNFASFNLGPSGSSTSSPFSSHPVKARASHPEGSSTPRKAASSPHKTPSPPSSAVSLSSPARTPITPNLPFFTSLDTGNTASPSQEVLQRRAPPASRQSSSLGGGRRSSASSNLSGVSYGGEPVKPSASSTGLSHAATMRPSVPPAASRPTIPFASTQHGKRNSTSATATPSEPAHVPAEQQSTPVNRAPSGPRPGPHPHPSATVSSMSQSSVTSGISLAPSSSSLLSPSLDSPSIPLEAVQLRTERKIADLEITNKSLLAINASLEMSRHRQGKELRELKRKIREGRISLPHTGNSGGDNAAMSTGGISDDALFSPGLSASDGFTPDIDGLPSSASRSYFDNRDDDDAGEGYDLTAGPLSSASATNRTRSRHEAELDAAHQRCKAMIDSMLLQGKRALAYRYIHDDSKRAIVGLGFAAADDVDVDADGEREVEGEDEGVDGGGHGDESAQALQDTSFVSEGEMTFTNGHLSRGGEEGEEGEHSADLDVPGEEA